MHYIYERNNPDKRKHGRFFLLNNFGIFSKEKFNLKLTSCIRKNIVFSKPRKGYIS